MASHQSFLAPELASIPTGRVAQIRAAMACPRAAAPNIRATDETATILANDPNHCTKLIQRSPPESTYVCSIRYSANGCNMIWGRYCVGKKRTLDSSAQ